MEVRLYLRRSKKSFVKDFRDLNLVDHYLREDVEREIARFCRGRWVAVEAQGKGGRIFYRYLRSGRPITVSEPADVKKILQRFKYPTLRTIYASANIYASLESKDDLREDNIVKVTPTWDVDGSLKEIELIKRAAEILLGKLEELGIDKSIYLIWSGRGVHIHLNENAISDSVWRLGALKIGFSIVEYILREATDELREVCGESRAERRLKVENVMDIQRVFTAPLSLHRELDLVAVALEPHHLDEFDISWCDVKRFKHWDGWSRFIEGEADELARQSLEKVKELGRRISIVERETPAKSMVIKRVGRFQVMALLQAARYYVLKGDLEKAKSFGLNRAIFYAWAKRHGPGTRRGASKETAKASRALHGELLAESLGDEIAYLSRDGWFAIGKEKQRPADFDRQIAYRFGGEEVFRRYWEAAVKYVESFPREILESQREFYEKVYLHVRDNLDKIFEHVEEEKA